MSGDMSRRELVTIGTTIAGVSALAFGAERAAAQEGFTAASNGSARHGRTPTRPGIQAVWAVTEVTGGGEKVYGVAVEYDAPIDPTTLSLDTYVAGVVPAAPGYFPGIPHSSDKNAGSGVAKQRTVASVYTNSEPALRTGTVGVPGVFVVLEFPHDPDLSVPTTDSDKVTLVQRRPVRTVGGSVYAAADRVWTNARERGNNVAIRGVDEWEQNHWWWDDKRSTWLEYSIYLPKSFLQPGGENRAYPLVLAITHSGTSYDGTCAQTLTEQCIASIWSLPEEQAHNECVVITPRYERTTMNDYWEHTYDVENTHRLVESLLQNTWNYGNPNLPDRADKTLRIDPKRVYCTGWSMGAMTSMWLMATHPGVYAAGLIIAGQQRPSDMAPLAKQKVLIITGTEDDKATPWNEKCVPVWRQAGGRVVRPTATMDPGLIFPVTDQRVLTRQMNAYLGENANVTFLTFQGVDHLESARKLFYIKAAREWLFAQRKV